MKSGARIKNSVLMKDAVVEECSYLEGTIVGWKSKIGKWVRINGLSVLGEETVISDEIYLNGSTVLPNVTVKTSQPSPGSVIMF